MPTNIEFPIWATGRRKESVARVRVIEGNGQFIVNNKTINDFFGGHVRARNDATAPLQAIKNVATYDFHITVTGGGVTTSPLPDPAPTTGVIGVLGAGAGGQHVARESVRGARSARMVKPVR